MHFEMVVKKRRMCREYLGSDVPQEKLDRVLDMASRYPSAGHTEPQELIEERGCEFLCKPSYSPDLNPIEEAFSKIKGLIRKAEARTREALVEAMGMAILAVTAQGARGFFEHSGYRLQIQSCDQRCTPAQLTLAQLLHQGDDIGLILVRAIPSASTPMSPLLTSG